MTSRGHAPAPDLIASRQATEDRAPEPLPEDAKLESFDVDGVEILRIAPPEAPEDSALLYFHGGGYRRGTARTYAAPVSRIAKACGIQAYSVGYGLAPERPYPYGLEDGIAAYRWLAERIDPSKIVIFGDSAGAGLAAALMLKIADLGLPKPAAGALYSAWADLRVTADSFDDCSSTDKLFTREAAEYCAGIYLDGLDPSDPFISPVLGDWGGQPPLLLHVSELEVLRDDSLLLAKVAADAGVDVTLRAFPDTQHIWHLDYPNTAASVEAVDNLRTFLARVL